MENAGKISEKPVTWPAMKKPERLLIPLFAMFAIFAVFAPDPKDREGTSPEIQVEKGSPNASVIGDWIDRSSSPNTQIALCGKADGTFQINAYVSGRGILFIDLKELPHPVGRRFVKDFSIDESSTTLTSKFKSFIQIKLNELVDFKDKESFHYYGFSVGGPYGSWLKEIEAARSRKEVTRREYQILWDLESLGLNLMRSKGGDDQSTFSTVSAIEAELRKEMPFGIVLYRNDEWFVATPSGNLEVWSNEGLIVELVPF
jgi:hypothetical protein